MGLPRADMKETYFRFNQLCMTVSERDGYNRVGHPDDCVGPWVIEIPRTVSGIHCTLRAHMTKETTKLALHLGAHSTPKHTVSFVKSGRAKCSDCPCAVLRDSHVKVNFMDGRSLPPTKVFGIGLSSCQNLYVDEK